MYYDTLYKVVSEEYYRFTIKKSKFCTNNPYQIIMTTFKFLKSPSAC